MRSTFIVFTCAATLASAAASGAQTFTGPSSSESPYIVPTTPGWAVASLITVGDSAAAAPYTMVGIPDGLGALSGRYRDGRYEADRTYLTVFMNHELRPGEGVAHDHGQAGAFVSQWTIHLPTLEVRRGEDLIQDVYGWDATTSGYVLASPAVEFNRFCSANLAPLTAFYSPWTGRGFRGRIFMNGEESGTEGRAFAHLVSGPGKGTTYQLASLGRFAWENSVAHPDAGDRTIVAGTDDSTPGQVYVYVGEKRWAGNPVERAGLVGGSLFGVKVTNGGVNYGGGAVTHENNGGIVNGTFTLVPVSAHADLASGAGAALQADSVAAGVTEFARPEDSAWDPTNPNALYFVTTGATIDGNFQWARLYKLTFKNIRHPQAGGRIDMILDASSALPRANGEVPPQTALFDNITVDTRGHVIIQEDPGNNAYLAKIWDVDPAKRAAVQIFESDETRFSTGGITIDEENSGVIEVTDLVTHAGWFENGRRYYLGDTQSHNPIGGALVEGGQLYLFASPKVKRPPHR